MSSHKEQEGPNALGPGIAALRTSADRTGKNLPSPHTGPRDPTGGGLHLRIARGLGYLPRAVRFLLGPHPEILPWCLVPALINILLFALAITLLFYFGDTLKEWLFALVKGEHHWALMILVYTMKGLVWIIYIAACLLIATALVYLGGNLLAAPFNDLLSEKVEECYTGQPAPVFSIRRFLRGIGLAISEEIKRILFFIAVLLALQLLHLIPLLGSVLNLVLGAWFSFFFLTMEYTSLPMARRHYRFGHWYRATRQNLALSTGFGAVFAGLLWVPLLNFVVIPLAVVGGTLLYCDLKSSGKLPLPPDETSPGGPRGPTI